MWQDWISLVQPFSKPTELRIFLELQFGIMLDPEKNNPWLHAGRNLVKQKRTHVVRIIITTHCLICNVNDISIVGRIYNAKHLVHYHLVVVVFISFCRLSSIRYKLSHLKIGLEKEFRIMLDCKAKHRWCFYIFTILFYEYGHSILYPSYFQSNPCILLHLQFPQNCARANFIWTNQ